MIGITGATGFVGGHLISELLERGQTLRLLVRNPEKLDADLRSHPDVEIISGDLSGGLKEFTKNLSCVIHLAGVVKAKKWADYVRSNVTGSANIASAAMEAGVERFVLLSSMVAREPSLSHYARSKLLSEAAVQRHFDGSTVILRAPAVFGPGDWATRPIYDLMARGILPVAGRDWQKSRIAMVYAPDLARVIADTLKGGYDGEVFSPATQGGVSWAEYADLHSQVLGRPVKIMPVPIPIIKTVALMTSISSRLFGMGHLTLGKLREFRHPDWTSADEIDSPTPLIRAFRETARSYGKIS